MTAFDRDEVEEAFRTYIRRGNVEEDWPAWADLFTEDAVYVEHVFGTMRGRDQIKAWIVPVMAANLAVYGVLRWYVVEGNRIVLFLLNRRDHPDPAKPPIDFPSLTVLEYAGNGRFCYEEDLYSAREVVRTTRLYREACRRHDPGFALRGTRRRWEGPDWARGDPQAPPRAREAARAFAEGRLPPPPIRPLVRPGDPWAPRRVGSASATSCGRWGWAPCSPERQRGGRSARRRR